MLYARIYPKCSLTIILAVLTILIAVAASANGDNMSAVGVYDDGPSRTFVAADGYGYHGHGGRVDIYSLDSLGRLDQLVGAYQAHAGVYDLEVSGGLLLLAGDHGLLEVLELTDPTAPLLIGQADIGGRVTRIARNGDLVAVGIESNGVALIDLGNPAAPTLLARADTWLTFQQLVLTDDLLIAAGTGSVRTYEIANPATPVPIDVLAIEEDADGVALAGDRLYVSRRYATLDTYDFSDPTSPVLLDQQAPELPFGALEVLGDRLFFTSRFMGFGSFELNSDGIPVVASVMEEGGGDCRRIVQVGQTLYLPSPREDLRLYDLADAANPSLVGQVENPGEADFVDVHGDLMLISSSTESWLADVSVDGNPTSLGPVSSSNSCRASVLADDLALISRYNEGLMFFDVQDPANPQHVGSYVPDSGAFNDAAVVGDLVFLVGEYGADNQIVDIADPASPVHVATLPGSRARDILVHGARAYIADNQLLIVDISDLENPVLLDEQSTSEWIFEMTYRDGVLYTVQSANQSSELVAYDVQADQAQEIGSVAFSGGCRGLAMDDRYAYLANRELGVLMVDTADPTAMAQVGSFATGQGCRDIDLDNGLIYAGQLGLGVWILQNDLIVVANEEADQQQPDVAPAGIQLSCYPNPFNPITNVLFEVPAAGRVTVDVFNARGQRVRTLVDGHVAAGRQLATWDGRADDGQRVAAGVYLARLRGVGFTRSAKLTLVE